MEAGGADEKEEQVRLEWRDYVALAIASLETIFLPIVVLLLVMAAILVLLL